MVTNGISKAFSCLMGYERVVISKYECNYMYTFITFCELIKYLGRNQYFPLPIITLNRLLFLVVCGPCETQVKMFLFFPAVKSSSSMPF